MAKEIERKFLFSPGKIDLTQYKSVEYIQGYLCRESASVRIRIAGENGFLTVKGQSSADGLCRSEFEYQIPKDDAQEMINEFIQNPVIRKRRYKIPLGDHVWELDVFSGSNEGLFLAEVELQSENETVELPDWIICEVTGDIRYYNSRLVHHPYSEWGSADD